MKHTVNKMEGIKTSDNHLAVAAKDELALKIFSQVRKTLGGFIFFVDFLNDYYVALGNLSDALVKTGFKEDGADEFLSEFWELVSLKSPFLVSKIKRLSVTENPRLENLIKDCGAYSPEGLESFQINEYASQVNLGFRVRNKARLISQMADFINEHPKAKNSYILEQLIKLSDPQKSELILSRFGVERPNVTLVELGENAQNGQTLSRERVRLIVNQSIRTIYLAEKKAEKGPLTNLIQSAEESVPPGSNAIEWIKTIAETAGLEDIDPLGATYMLSSLGFNNIYRNKKTGFMYDPLMPKEVAEEAIDDFRRANKVRKAKKRPKSQRTKPILISCSQETKDDIKRICEKLKISRFDFISKHATDAVIMSCESRMPKWKQDGWVSIGLRIDIDQLEKINFECKVRKEKGKKMNRVILLNSILEHLVEKFRYLIEVQQEQED